MPSAFRASLATYSIVAASSLFFCSKAIFVKLAFRYGMDPVTVLALRMSMAFPFFVVGGWMDAKRNPRPLVGRDWVKLALLGFLGWYLSSIVNFAGLQYVSVGLERMILYTYPSLVVLGAVIFFGKPLRGWVVAAMLISYAGIAIGYHAEARIDLSGKTWLGASLIFTSAVTYAVFVLLSGQLVKRIGAARFTSCVVGFSGVFVFIHFGITHDIHLLFNLSHEAYACGVALAIAGTVIPSYLFAFGLQRAGSQAFAVIGMAGPLGTVVLAWLLLGESVNAMQVMGLALTLGGGVFVSLLKERR